MRIGILTGGGDTPSLNAILYGAALQSEELGHKLTGFRYGWRGVLNPVDYLELHSGRIDPNIGGTLLRTSRTNLDEQTIDEAVDNIEDTVDGLIAIGGDDTLTVGKKLIGKLKIPICFITKTIDNDVGRNAPEGEIDFSQIINYFTSGFATAASRVAAYAADLRTTAYSHERIMFLEAMGREPGWLALASYAGEPDFILVPEVELDFERFKENLAERYQKKGCVVVVVAEGVRYKGSDKPISQDESNIDAFAHKRLGGAAEVLSKRVKKELGMENSNYVNPNYLYRSGSPTRLDKETGIMLGKEAATAIDKGVSGEVAVLQRVGDNMIAETKPIDEVVLTGNDGKIIPRTLDLRFYDAERYTITRIGREYFKPILEVTNV